MSPSRSGLTKLSFAFAVGMPLAALVAFACSSSSSGADLADASTGPQALGAACDPTTAQPCVSSGSACTGIVCDPALHVCIAFDTDAGAPCNAASRSCASSADCDLGDVCGFAVGGGCSAIGTCIDLPLPCENDAASCVTEPPACGCDGLPDPFVVPGFASSPVASASASACDGGGVFVDATTADADAAVAVDAGSG